MAATVERTIIGPLTTTFTPAASCTIPTAVITNLEAGGFTAFGAQFCDANSSPNDHGANTKCWPPASQGAPAPDTVLSGWGFYSPGLICPVGFTSACTATAGGVSGYSVKFSMVAGETAVGCCPSGYTCTAGSAQSCYSQAGYSDTFSMATCSFGSLVDFRTISIPYTTSASVSDGSSSTYQVASFNLWEPMIELRWQSSDLAARATMTDNSPPPTAATSSATNAAAMNTDSGLSTGAQAGIGVGVAVGVLALLGAGFLFWRRSRKQSQITENRAELEHPPPTGTYQQAQPLISREMDAPPKPPSELDSTMLGSKARNELSANRE